MRNPGIYRDYPSSMCSPFYCWFKDAGYPELDVKRWPDGEWAIVQYLNTPLIPCLTRWQYTLTGMRNVEINHANVMRLVDQVDLEKKQAWAEVEASEQRALDLAIEQDRRAEDFSEKAFKLIRGNDRAMQRLAKTGNIAEAINPAAFLRHIPRHQLRNMLK